MVKSNKYYIQEEFMKTRLYLIRHGESLGNMERRFLGHTDLDLSELGYIQADMTAKALADVHFDYIYSSDLIRAYNTALPHAKLRDMKINTSKELREIYVGKWEGKTVDEILEEYEDLFINGWRRNFGLTTPPNGESVLSGGKRFFSELKRIASAHKGKTVLVASHAAVIRSFWSIVMGLKPEKFAEGLHFAGNASFSIVDFEDGVFTPIEYSNSEHLGELATYVDERIEQ